MVSGKPPRHSRTKAEPVTIDLDAKDVKTLGPGEIEPDTAEPNTGEPAVTADQPSPETTASTPSTSTPIEPHPNVDLGDEPKAEKPSFEEQLTAVSEKPETAESDVKEPEQQEEKVFSAPPPPQQPSSAPAKQGNSGFIAAGIFGGLVALFAAGSMQYAGYLPPFSSSANQNAENALSAEIATLKAQLTTLQLSQSAPTVDTSALEARLAALENAEPAAAGSVDNAAVTALTDKIAALEGTVSSLQSERSAQETATADLTRRLTDAETKLNEPRDDIEVARAIASAGLKAAVDRGGPFLTELDTLSGVAADDPSVAALKPFAATGVPSRAELLRTFPETANAMLATLNQPDPNQSIVERLTESAYSLVKVRPVGNIEGKTPEAIVARMEDKMRNGDLQGAALEWNALPDAAKTVSTAYKQSLDARIEVEKLVGDSLSRAITSSGQKG